MRSNKRLLLPMIVLALAALACNLPGRLAPVERTATASAATISAQLTEMALTLNPSLQPNLTQSPLVTLPPTVTLAPAKPSSTPAPTSVPIPCDRAEFVQDITINDGTKLSPGQAFTKTWRLKNTGSCTWNSAYTIIFDSGERMNGPASTNLAGSVAPGQMVDISLNLTAPTAPNKYKGNWKLRNANGVVFGLTYGGPFYVDVEVVAATPTATSTLPAGTNLIYDFVSNYCNMDWSSSAGALTCPGGTADNSGFVVKVDSPKLETGATASGAGIESHPTWETHPAWGGNGWIQGITKNPIVIKPGYRLRTQIGCLNGASTCNVNFTIKYNASSTGWVTLGTWNETYDSSMRELDIDLSSLAEKSVIFTFYVDAASNGGQDWAIWVNPRIVK